VKHDAEDTKIEETKKEMDSKEKAHLTQHETQSRNFVDEAENKPRTRAMEKQRQRAQETLESLEGKSQSKDVVDESENKMTTRARKKQRQRAKESPEAKSQRQKQDRIQHAEERQNASSETKIGERRQNRHQHRTTRAIQRTAPDEHQCLFDMYEAHASVCLHDSARLVRLEKFLEKNKEAVRTLHTEVVDNESA